MRRIILLIAICLGLAMGFSGAASAQVPPGYAGGEYGYAVKKPVIAGACHFCPWGALADVVIAAMKPYGWDVHACYNCSGANSIRIPGGKKIPSLPSAGQIATGAPPPPYAPVDMGATSPGNLYDAYHGQGQFKDDGAYTHLRLVVRVDSPSYFVVAVKESSGITDLAQIKAKKMPVRIYSSGAEGTKVLEYYGLTKEALESWGGSLGPATGGRGGRGGADIVDAANPADANAGRGANPGRGGRGANAAPVPENRGGRARNIPDFDVYLYSNAVMANNPESNLMYQITQLQKLVFLQMPDDLLYKLAEWPQERVAMPQAYFAGADRNIQTVGRNGQVVYVRDDAPDNFTYDLAKAMDKQKALLKWNVLPFSYDPATATNVKDVPLAPGAARYYREAGYIK